MGYYGFKPYIPVGRRRAQALKEVKKLQKNGKWVFPVEVVGKKITQTFWGSAWCKHIESYSDYDNRLPRGRSYVRHGSVYHLDIHEGCVEAKVLGSSRYEVKIKIKTLSESKWSSIKKHCAGQIGSLLELLAGKLSTGVMEVVCDPHFGLFPEAKDIELSCSCPDWADMCKHVAAVLYGVGVRLDAFPEKLFELRGVPHGELMDASFMLDNTLNAVGKRRRIDDSSLSDVFNINISDVVVNVGENAKEPKK